jgi:hypothetical protein
VDLIDGQDHLRLEIHGLDSVGFLIKKLISVEVYQHNALKVDGQIVEFCEELDSAKRIFDQ